MKKMIRELNAVYLIIRKYFLFIFVLPIFISILFYYIFNFIEPKRVTGINYQYNISFNVEKINFNLLYIYLNSLSNVLDLKRFSIIDNYRTSENFLENKIDFDLLSRKFYLNFFNKVAINYVNLDDSQQFDDLYVNELTSYSANNHNFTGFYRNNKYFQISFKSTLNDIQFYKNFFLEIINDNNKLYSQYLFDLADHEFQEIDLYINNLEYLLKTEVNLLNNQISVINKDVVNLENKYIDFLNDGFLNYHKTLKEFLLNKQNLQDQINLSLEQIAKFKQDIEKFKKLFSENKTRYVSDIFSLSKAPAKNKKINFVSYYIQYFSYIFFVILILLLVIIYEYNGKRKN